MRFFSSTFSTPFGDFSVAVDEAGALAATAFGGTDSLAQRLRMDDLVADDDAVGSSIRDQVLGYFAGQRRAFTVALAAQGTPFQTRVWSALREIPFGQTRSYGELAAALGNPGAARAIGRANATNPICLIVPCHRVIGRDGSLTGFAFGADLKRRLLDYERSVAHESRAA